MELPGPTNSDAAHGHEWSVEGFEPPSLTIEYEPAPSCPADITGDGVVDASDLAAVLGAWGPCE